MTDHFPADAEEYDELAGAAAKEYADGLTRHRRLRAWLISVSASACVLLIALTVVSLIEGPRQRSLSADRDRPVPFPSLLNIDQSDQLSKLGVRDALVLLTIALPPGWISSAVSSSVTSIDPASGTVVSNWSTTWTTGDHGTDGPRVIAAALTNQGWQRCSSGEAHTECWRLGTHQLILTWRPGPDCPARGPCWQAGVTMSTVPPPTSSPR